MEVIEKSEAIAAVSRALDFVGSRDAGAAVDALRKLPGIEMQTARWIFIESDDWSNVFRCSRCSNICTTELFEHSPIDAERFWCSRCGAKMRRAEDAAD